VAIFSSQPLSGRQGKAAETISRDRIARLAAGREAPQSCAIRLSGKKAGRNGLFEYQFGTGADAGKPWNAGPDFTLAAWENYSDAVWSNIALAVEQPAGAVINSVFVMRSGVVLFDSSAKASVPSGKTIDSSLKGKTGTSPVNAQEISVFDLGPPMAAFRSAYYETEGNPILAAAYGELGRTDSRGYTLSGKQWCSEFSAWAYRTAGYDCPDPDQYEASWRTMRDHFSLTGNVYTIKDVLSWPESKKRSLILPGSFVSLVMNKDGTAHSFIFTQWVPSETLDSFSGISGNNMGTVYSHAAVSLRSRAPEADTIYAQRSFIAVPRAEKKRQSRIKQYEWKYIDRVSADEDSRIFRTGEMSPVVESIGPMNGATIESVAVALAKGSASPMETARRLHDWITRYIAYDSDLLVRLKADGNPEGGNDADSAFQYRRTNCAGLAQLYYRMAKAAGVQARVVIGYIKKGETSRGDLVSHAWNIITAGKKEYIVDCSPDSRTFWKKGTLTPLEPYNENSDNLFISPAAKAVAYLASRPADQLLKHPMTVADFRTAPRFTIAAAIYGIELSGADGAVRKEVRLNQNAGASQLADEWHAKNGILTLTFKTPDDTWIDAYLFGTDNKSQPSRVKVDVLKGSTTVQFSAPSEGTFRCTLNTRSLARPGRIQQAYEFRLTAGSSAAPFIKGIKEEYAARMLGIRITAVTYDDAAGEWIVDTECPETVRLIGILRDSKDEVVAGAGRFIPTSSGFHLYYSTARAGIYSLTITGRSLTDTTGKGNLRMFTIKP
jgi:hypothetical protein